MKKKGEAFKKYVGGLSAVERDRVELLLDDADATVGLSKRQNALLVKDFEAALLSYAAQGLPLEDALIRLNPAHLGDFYRVENETWYPLDNAAKVFPLTMTSNWMAVFRVSAYLNKEVNPALLQMALNFTIKRFPYFATTVKKGVFWHYLDGNMRRYEIIPETYKPCSYMKVAYYNSPCFKVLYFGRRVAVEFFHILTDGAGGLAFLKTLVAEYLRLTGKEIPATNGVLDVEEQPKEEEWSNAFLGAEESPDSGSLIQRPALQLDGKSEKSRPYRVLHFIMDSDKLRALAKSKGVSVTVLLLSYMFIASKSAISKEGIINIQVPMNMRSRRPSATMRNYAIFSLIKLHTSDITTVDDLAVIIKKQLDEQSSEEALKVKLASTNKTVKNCRHIPLIIKRPVMLSGSGIAVRMFTNTLSNLGVVDTPAEMKEYIDKFDCYMGNPANKKVGCNLISYNGKLVFTIVKSIKNDTYENTLYRLLTEDGIAIEVEGTASV